MESLSNILEFAEKFGIKIAKDGVFRTAEEILTQKGIGDILKNM